MEGKMRLGVKRKRATTRRSRKKFLKHVVNYLTSDTYMYSSLISTPPFDSSDSEKTSVHIRGVAVNVPIEEGRKTKFGEMLKYLKSDTYLYAPLLVLLPPPCSNTKETFLPSGQQLQFERASREILSRNLCWETRETAKETLYKKIHDKGPKDYHVPASISPQQIVAHMEVTKKVVHANCCSSSVPGT
ncbi:hypothetical protein Nepgr_032822 [Nepenthes gracilis]|uniref:Uncharacterized protein n=1 Tax=Nepenthes gracilis TaxID=150966 RepID=A0AAD3TKT8_NEPGR|nr:hypothetical protein Nepgr_032822 [Nepenthes gracilis]